jgi:hypothetical protein
MANRGYLPRVCLLDRCSLHVIVVACACEEAQAKYKYSNPSGAGCEQVSLAVPCCEEPPA